MLITADRFRLFSQTGKTASSALENGFAVLQWTKQLHGTVSGDPGPAVVQIRTGGTRCHRGSINVDSRRRIFWRVRGASLKPVSTRLREPDGGDRPLSIVASDGDSQAVHLIEPKVLHGSSLSIGKYDSLADKLSPGLLELAKDRGCSDLHN
jgi:hypothetical protein